jgi:hypothetical protein
MFCGWFTMIAGLTAWNKQKQDLTSETINVYNRDIEMKKGDPSRACPCQKLRPPAI